MSSRHFSQARARRWGVWFGGALFVLAGLILGVVLSANPGKPVRPITLTTAEWAPYVSASLPGDGPLVSVVSNVFRRAGYDPQVTFTSWSMTETTVDDGTSLAMFPVIASSTRRAKYLVSDSITDFDYVLFHRVDDAPGPISTAGDLARQRVGFVDGYDYWPELEDAVGDRAVRYDSSLDGFQALADGEIDLFAEGLVSGSTLLAGDEFPHDARDFGYVRSSDPLVRSTESLRLVLADTSANQQVLRDFNRALAAYRETSEYRALTAVSEDAGNVSTHALIRSPDGAVALGLPGGEQLTPSGTAVKVLRWPASPTRSATPVRVKVLDGPLAGRVGTVALRHLVLDGGSR